MKKILLTGATGYIGKRLLPVLVENGYEVLCAVRDQARLNLSNSLSAKVKVIEIDFSQSDQLHKLPKDIDGAYYLMHSMSNSKDYYDLEQTCAINFRKALESTHVKHVVYLSGIVNDSSLSRHLASRKNVEKELSKASFHLSTLRSGIIIGSGSASFEIIRDLVEKLPVMVAPRWLKTKSQPIGVSDVIYYLQQILFNPRTYDRDFDIGGQEVLSYKQILLGYAKVRGLSRKIFVFPVMTPRLSSYWLYFVTSTAYNLAVSLVDSMKVEVVCRNQELSNILEWQPMSYTQALKRAFLKIEANEIVSSWKDSLISGVSTMHVGDFINVPQYGCYKDKCHLKVKNKQDCLNRIWSIGGETGWYYADWLWRFRGFIDKLVGGIGLRRGRTNKYELNAGDALDCWRVLYSNKEEGKLLLFAEMKLPGEAWLEFKIEENTLFQTATFRPRGLFGRLYWLCVLPFHFFIFNGMIKRITRVKM